MAVLDPLMAILGKDRRFEISNFNELGNSHMQNGIG